MTARVPSQAARLLTDAIPDQPVWADLRRSILDGSVEIHSDPLSWIAGCALTAIATARKQALEEMREQAARDSAAIWRRGVRGVVQALDRTIVAKWQHSKRRQWRDAGSEISMVLGVLHDAAAMHSPASWADANALDDVLVDAIVPLIGRAIGSQNDG